MPGKTSARYSCEVLPGARFENINVLTRKAAEWLRHQHSEGLAWVKVFVDDEDFRRIQVGNLPYLCGKGPTGWFATPLWKREDVDGVRLTLWFESYPVATMTGVMPANVVHALRTAVYAGTLRIGKGETGIVRACIGIPGESSTWFHDYAVKVGRWGGEVTVDYRWDSSLHYPGARR